MRGRERAAFLTVLGTALFVRVAWVAFATRVPRGLHDPFLYLLRALQIATGNGYTYDDGSPSAYYPVGYPLTLGVLFRLVGFVTGRELPSWADLASALRTGQPDYSVLGNELVWAASGLNVLLSTGSVCLVYLLARRLTGRRTALLAGLWMALFPSLVFHTSVMLTEPLFIFLLLAALATLLLAPDDLPLPSFRRRLLFGVLLGGSALVRPPALLCLPLVPWTWWRAGLPWAASARATGAVLLGLALTVLPWTLRNLWVMPGPVLISTNVGDNLCIGHNPAATGHFGLPPACSGEAFRDLPPSQREYERNRHNMAVAVRFALSHPARELRLIGLKLIPLLHHDHSGLMVAESWGKDPFLGRKLRALLSRTADTYYFATLTLAVLGAFAFVRASPGGGLVVGSALVLLMTPLAFFGDARFHIPSLPLLVLPAASLCVAQGRRLVGLVRARARRPRDPL